MINRSGSRRRPGILMGTSGALASLALLVATQATAQIASQRPRALAFEANRGQASERVKFLARGAGYTAFLTSDEAILTLSDRRGQRSVVGLRPVGASDAASIRGDTELPGVANYFLAGRPISAPTYDRVRYVGVYPGVDLVYYGRPSRLEYDFVVAPGADPDRIALAFDGVGRLEVDDAGDLVAHTAAGELRQPRPVAYQEIDGARRRVVADYVLDGEQRVRFRLGAYEPSRPLVIDPVLAYSTYLGGTGDDADSAFDGEVAIVADGAGNLYVAGTTPATDFPTTPGANQTPAGGLDIFVTKLSPAGTMLYSTYLGGPCDDFARDIAVDAAGNAYVTGRVHGGVCWADVTAGALVAKLDPTGAVVYASVLGGRLADSSIGQAIAVDAEGHAYVAGVASTDSDDFPTTAGAFRTGRCANVYSFAGDVFVAKLSPDGRSLVYSTLLCGSGDDSPSGIGIDAAGNVYVAGTTASSDFPTVNPIQDSRRNGPVGVTGFVSKLSPDGSRLVYSTYLGGSESDAIGGMAVDAQGSVYVTGETQSQDFPTTPGVLQERSGNRLCIETCTDAFVTKIDPSGSDLVYSTYLFGELDEGGSRIAVDRTGNAYVVGTTTSSRFPLVGAFQSTNRGVFDAFVVKLNPDGTRLVYSSYLGGDHSGESPRTGYEQGTGIALDASGNAYVAGYTQSFDFPTTPGAVQPNLKGDICDVFGTPCGDSFIAKVTAGGPGVVPPVSLTEAPAEIAPGGVLTATWAGIPGPGANDEIRLYALGSPDGYPGEMAWRWPTAGAAAGTLSLKLPDGLATGWYELRLASRDPEFASLLTVVARSEPILVTGTTTSTPPTTIQPTTTTLPSISSCDVAGAAACDDGDPCTVDSCVAGQGCLSVPVTGVASVTCTCGRAGPAACSDQTIPVSIGKRHDRACGLFGDAAGTTNHAMTLKRLKKGAGNLNASVAVVSKARKKGKLSDDCADALKAELRDAKARVDRVLGK